VDLLIAENLYGGYGGTDILNGVSLKVKKNQIVVIVGPNGAGKSTAMKSIVGFVDLRLGEVKFGGKSITNFNPDVAAKLRIAYVPQEKNVFASMSVNENLEMGAYLNLENKSKLFDQVFSIFPALFERKNDLVGTLSGGQRQMVAIGRAMMLDPKLLLLDEPTVGLSPKFTKIIFEKIKEINSSGVSVLMVEQNAREALEVADYGYILVMGRNRHQNSATNLLESKEVGKMFLGA
jgi:branched-chain amino acid transport system ATP-binding protein